MHLSDVQKIICRGGCCVFLRLSMIEVFLNRQMTNNTRDVFARKLRGVPQINVGEF